MDAADNSTGPSEADGEGLPTRRSMRAPRNVAATASATDVLSSPGGSEPGPARGRRLLVAAGVAALGAGALAVGSRLAAMAGSPTHGQQGGSGETNGTDSNAVGGGEMGAGPAPVAPPGATMGQSGGGAPVVPGQIAEASDRDESHGQGVAEIDRPKEYDPGLPAGRTNGPMSVPVADSPEARHHLLKRAGYGIGAIAEREVEQMGLDAWLTQQLDPAYVDPFEATALSWFPFAKVEINSAEAAGVDRNETYPAYINATLARQIYGKRQIYENVVDVFENHLYCIRGTDLGVGQGNDYGNAVIRPHALGRFRDMLLASARHPYMMKYLNNTDSVDGEINENYGRELLELHTVGVGSGYSEDDVKASATILSGRRAGSDRLFAYEPKHHVTGAVRVMDFASDNATTEGGMALGDEFLNYLATHPATARTVARKLAVRFVSDYPDPALVERLAQTYLDNDTDIRAVLVEIFRSDDFWHTAGSKIRRPLEDVVGTIRAIGADSAKRDGTLEMVGFLGLLGHRPLSWGPPNGYPDVWSAWMSASQLVQRWNEHFRLVGSHREHLLPSSEFTAIFTPAPGQTVDAWVDAMCRFAIGEPASQQILDAARVLHQLPVGSTVPADLSGRVGPEITALFFHSVQFSVR